MSGMHKRNGIFFACAPCIKKGYRIKQMSIYDFLPTVLYLGGFPIPDDVDGSIKKEIVIPNCNMVKSYIEVNLQENKVSKYSPSEEAEIKKRLEGLGYL